MKTPRRLYAPLGAGLSMCFVAAAGTSAIASVTTGTTLCPADFNGVGGVTVQDIFDFLTAYFTPCP